MNLEIRNISGLETYPVRHPVLRHGRPVEDCYFTGDDLDTTIHLGIFVENKLVGVATFLLNHDATITSLQHHNKESCYQLRGMAVLKEMRGSQLGEKLLQKGEKLLIKNGVTALWFNARIAAVPFYKRLDYKVISDPFEIEPIGTHYKMYKSL